MLALLIVVAGLVTLGILPIAQYPDITPPTVQVSAVYPGANAQTVAQTVGIPIRAASKRSGRHALYVLQFLLIGCLFTHHYFAVEQISTWQPYKSKPCQRGTGFIANPGSVQGVTVQSSRRTS